MRMRLQRLLKPLFLSFGLCIVVLVQAQQYRGLSSCFPQEEEVVIREFQVSKRGVRGQNLTVSYYSPRNCREVIREVIVVYPARPSRRCVGGDRVIRVSYYSTQNPTSSQTYSRETSSGKLTEIITTTTTTTHY